MRVENSVSLRIAFDLDGTLADMEPALEEIAARLFPEQAAQPKTAAADARPAGLGAGPAAASQVTENGPTATTAPAAASGESLPPARRNAHASQAGEGGLADRARTLGGRAEAETSNRDPGSDQLSPEEEQLEPPSVRMLTRRQQSAIWDEVRRTENFWESLPEIAPGTVSRIAATAEERRWEVIFITTRPDSGGDTTQRQSQRWLAAHGFPFPSVFVAPGSRGKIAAALSLDIVVDDRAENCLDVKLDSQARSVLVARDANPQTSSNAKRLGIDMVVSVAALLDELDETPPERPSLLGRLKTMIGAGKR